MDRHLADLLLPVLDATFDESGHTISLFEAGEDSGKWVAEILFFGIDETAIAKQIRESLVAELQSLKWIIEPVDERDWVAESLKGLIPVRVGRFLVFGHHDRHHRKATDIAIEIEAGLAFGTGHHGTTAGCLELLGDLAKRRRFRRPLDLGCGSAVLAIGLARTFKVPVVASDIDPVAVAVARNNGRLNGVGNLLRPICSAGFANHRLAELGPYDLIVANILARPLMRLAGPIRHQLQPGGVVVLSGLRPADEARICWAYRQFGFSRARRLVRDNWLSLILSDRRAGGY